MKAKALFVTVSACASLLSAGLAWSAEQAAKAPQPNASAPVRHKTKPAAKPRIKLVDINGASKAALMKLPGITDTQADKIIANRPYGSKVWLITNQVLDRATYEGIKGLVEARQPYTTAEQNAAVYEKLKKDKAAKP